MTTAGNNTSKCKQKSGKKKTIRIALDIEYYEKIQLFCERYNRKLNETLKGVLEEFVDEIEKNDPLYHTLIKDSALENQSDTKQVKGKGDDSSAKSVETKSETTEKKPEKKLSSILLETVKK